MESDFVGSSHFYQCDLQKTGGKYSLLKYADVLLDLGPIVSVICAELKAFVVFMKVQQCLCV